MTFGITSQGFVAKRLEDIKAELEAAYRVAFAADIKVTPDTTFGKIIGIHADREARLWELAEAIYNSAYPETASGVSLARIGDITDITPNPATKSTSVVYIAGTEGTAIQSGTLVATTTANDRFRFVTNTVIDGSQFSVDSINRTGDVALVTAYGHDLDLGAYVFITGANQEEYNGLHRVDAIIDEDNFEIAVEDEPTTPATGVIQAVQGTPANVESVKYGPIQALAGTLTQIVNPVVGWSLVSNPLDAVLGRVAESDAAFRVRRKNALRGLGAARLEAILGAILSIQDVVKAVVFENETDVTAGGRPPHSIECLVVGGDTQTILDTVWNKKAGGIQSYGNVSGIVTDSQGAEHECQFSRPTEVPIYLELDLTVLDTYPDDGDEIIREHILDYGNDLEIGADVIVFPTIISLIGLVPGIIDIEVRIGIAPNPSTDDNVIISETSVAIFDSTRIEITTTTA